MANRVQTLHDRNQGRIEAVCERYAILCLDAPDVEDPRREAFEQVFGASFGAVDMDALASELAEHAEAYRAAEQAEQVDAESEAE